MRSRGERVFFRGDVRAPGTVLTSRRRPPSPTRELRRSSVAWIDELLVATGELQLGGLVHGQLRSRRTSSCLEHLSTSSIITVELQIYSLLSLDSFPSDFKHASQIKLVYVRRLISPRAHSSHQSSNHAFYGILPSIH